MNAQIGNHTTNLLYNSSHPLVLILYDSASFALQTFLSRDNIVMEKGVN